MTDQDGYTPTTEEARAAFVAGAAYVRHEDEWGAIHDPWDTSEDMDEQSDRLAGEAFDRWLAAHDAEVRAADREALADEIDDRLVAERAWDEGRDAIIRYSMKHVENEPEEIAGYIDQHIVGFGGSKLVNPYRKEQEAADV